MIDKLSILKFWETLNKKLKNFLRKKNIISKTINLNKLVSNWDLYPDKQKEKIEILKNWKSQLNKDEYNVILEICKKFNYYSERLTSEVYKNIYIEKSLSIKDFEDFTTHSLFLPLRKKERIESAVSMFSSFIYTNKIDVNRTHVNGPADYLKKFKSSTEYYVNFIENYDKEDKELRNTIEVLKLELNNYPKGQKIYSKVKKRIGKLQKRQNKKELFAQKLLEDFHRNYLSIKNLILIDDFIGTGESVIKVLKEINKILSGSSININLFLWVIEANESGINSIKDKAKELEIEIDISAYKSSIDVLEEDIIFPSDDINNVKEIIKDINKRNKLKQSTYCKNHAIASYVNAPNNNLTLLSEESATWSALFLRDKRNEIKRNVSSSELKDTLQFLRQ
ncbi:hypothetical protein HNQ44_001919 [Planomicrobium koreense]|uniref:PRTase-CE domain-containing protein n=1 Tax=Planococcus koreensis TaxID=112331 RepID=A0A7W8FTW9_9BACL|nr:hypothetical protein [Planococcus koreensis]MBB5180491.1 hypothetical protein [Planococcus koreensis]